MRTYSNKPNVRVTVSGIPSACNADCTYEFLPDASVPTISAVTLTGYTLSFTLTGTGSLTSTMKDFTITLDNQPCTNLVGTLASFTCTLPKNADNTPILTAGTYFPIVKLSPIGYLPFDPSVTAITTTLALTSVASNSGGINGGYEVTIAATGLPSDPTVISFSLCSKKCSINSISNKQAKIMIPECSSEGLETIEATFNTLAATVAFTYEPTDMTNGVTITAI